MKFISVQFPGQTFPVPVLFPAYVKHTDIAKRLALPVLSAGFVALRNDGSVECSGFSNSLNKGPGYFDADVIRAAIASTNSNFPPAPTT